MTRPEDVDPLKESHWNLQQAIAWIMTRDLVAVARFSEQVTDWGTITKKVTTPDGLDHDCDESLPPPNVLSILNWPIRSGNALLVDYTSCKRDLLSAIGNGKLRAWGTLSGHQGVEEIPQFEAPSLDVWTNGDRNGVVRFGPKLHGKGTGGRQWHGVRMLLEEILKEWPAPNRIIDATQTNDSSASDRPNVSIAALQNWYREHHIPKMTAENIRAAESKDMSEAKQAFPNHKIPRKSLRDVRRELAPADWKTTRKPKGVTGKAKTTPEYSRR